MTDAPPPAAPPPAAPPPADPPTDAPPSAAPLPTGYAAHAARRESAPLTPDTPGVVRNGEWARHGERWRGAVDGLTLGTGVTLLFYFTDTVGNGPKLHVHPYDEVFIVREGRGRFTIGDRLVDAAAGDILVGPANVPHTFVNLGPGRLATTDVHLSDRWIQTDLEA